MSAPQISLEVSLSQFLSENLEIVFKNLDPREQWTEVGAGAQGTVYKTSYFGTQVAIKLSSNINADNSAPIVQEIKMLKSLRHPKLVEFMGFSLDPTNKICIVTEFLGGGSLFELLHKPAQSLTWRDNLLQYAIDICEGMAYMHAQTPQILHRDLKSPNILITENGTTAKIADFGFARMYAEVMSTRGTPRWMAPEVLSGNSEYTEKVDVFSFGIVLWEMCTRAIPYDDVVEIV
ncbi:kinase [Thraustotheca clavata]|uniref:Kinase n=1 Tax=Thraustotheca clavata TaxID=74557 RepID=A0A1V9Y8W9_9STRA|nr:kinase [Thraustotheca clavata]